MENHSKIREKNCMSPMEKPVKLSPITPPILLRLHLGIMHFSTRLL